MKKNYIKIISCIILAIITVFLTTACGGSVNSRWASYDESNFISDTSSSKIVKEKITINLFAPKSTTQGDWNDMVLWKKMEELTNIHIEWETVPLTSYSEKRSLKWLDTKNPSDAFFLSNSMSEVASAAQYNRIAALDDLIDQFAPNYKSWIEQYPEIKKVSSYNDKIYVFSSVNTSYGEFAMQYINKAWLDKIGQAVPKNIDELYIAFKAFSDYDVNGNGVKGDEIPISYFEGDATVNFIMSAFGFVGTGCELNSLTDEIVYVKLTENYRDYLKFMNRLYAEGLLDSNIFSNKSSDLAQKGQNNTLGCFSDAASYLTVGTKYADDYVPIGPLTSLKNSSKLWYQTGYNFSPSVMIINNDTPYKRELVRWIDALYSLESESWQTVGIEGENWDWDDESHTNWTFKVPDGYDEEAYRTTISYTAGLGSQVLKTDFSTLGNTALQIKIRNERQNYITYLKTSTPQLSYSVSQSNSKSDIEAQLDSYCSNMEANFIKGNKNPNDDTEWQAYISMINKIGVSDLLKIYNDAYETYKNS
jgi:putative aldouronate transport system substrate-binding protein